MDWFIEYYQLMYGEWQPRSFYINREKGVVEEKFFGAQNEP
jgi:hypothetical protein